MLALLLGSTLSIALAPQSPPASPSRSAVAGAQEPRDLRALLAAMPQKWHPLLDHPRDHRLQILVGEPFVDQDGRVRLRQSSLGDRAQYFYPASTVKLGAAVATLLELQRRAASGSRAASLDAEWAIARRFPGEKEPAGPIAIRRDLRQLLVVSDNAAFNHCYEFVGPRPLNEVLWQAGFVSARIWHRLDEAHPLSENRQSRAVTLRRGDVVEAIAARDDIMAFGGFDNGAFTDLEIGTAYRRGSERIATPMSFAQKNAIALADLQALLAAIVRPEIDTGRRGFPELGTAARAFVVESLAMLPRECADPVYAVADYPDEYCKWVLSGARRVVPAVELRDYSKTGQAYGFTIENAYLEDRRTGRGVFVAAVLYTNDDGELGDDRYEYDSVALPFFADLGEVIARLLVGEGR